MFTELLHYKAVANNATDVRTAHAVTTCLHMLERAGSSKIPGWKRWAQCRRECHNRASGTRPDEKRSIRTWNEAFHSMARRLLVFRALWKFSIRQIPLSLHPHG
jgi:hypothetical protein